MKAVEVEKSRYDLCMVGR